MDVISMARELASTHPSAKLPCPVCGASLNAENLDKHLGKVHPGATAVAVTEWKGKGWLGVFPVSLALVGETFELRHYLGMAKRTVPLPCAIEVGGNFRTRHGVVIDTDITTHRTGRYLRLVGERNAITVSCKQSTQFTSHWDRTGWRTGARQRGWDIRVPLEVMLAIEYALAQRGVLRPK